MENQRQTLSQEIAAFYVLASLLGAGVIKSSEMWLVTLKEWQYGSGDTLINQGLQDSCASNNTSIPECQGTPQRNTDIVPQTWRRLLSICRFSTEFKMQSRSQIDKEEGEKTDVDNDRQLTTCLFRNCKSLLLDQRRSCGDEVRKPDRVQNHEGS